MDAIDGSYTAWGRSTIRPPSQPVQQQNDDPRDFENVAGAADGAKMIVTVLRATGASIETQQPAQTVPPRRNLVEEAAADLRNEVESFHCCGPMNRPASPLKQTGVSEPSFDPMFAGALSVHLDECLGGRSWPILLKKSAD